MTAVSCEHAVFVFKCSFHWQGLDASKLINKIILHACISKCLLCEMGQSIWQYYCATWWATKGILYLTVPMLFVWCIYRCYSGQMTLEGDCRRASILGWQLLITVTRFSYFTLTYPSLHTCLYACLI